MNPAVASDSRIWELGIVILGGVFTLLAILIPLMISTRKSTKENGLNNREEFGVLNSRVQAIATHLESLLSWRTEFEHRWSPLPDTIGDGKKLASKLDEISNKMNELVSRIELHDELTKVDERIDHLYDLIKNSQN